MSLEPCVLCGTVPAVHITPTKHRACGDCFTPLTEEEERISLRTLLTLLEWIPTGETIAPRAVGARTNRRFLGGIDV